MDMGGMEMSSDPVFRNVNEKLAHDYWYIIAGVFCMIVIFRILEWRELRSRLRCSISAQFPTRPNNAASQVFATTTAILREMCYPQLHFGGFFSWLSPPPLGGIMLLLCYWAMITYMLTANAIINDAQYYERIGFRAAWIALTQVPFVYLLSSKASVIAWIVGSSYERLNWLHRWVSRTLLVTVTVHGAFFLREWIRADFLALELAMMPMVKYGIGAWFILVWTFLRSLAPLRRVAYEFFILQHFAAAAVFLWVLWVHVPKYSAYFVWFSVGAMSVDWVSRCLLLLYQNIHRAGFGYHSQVNVDGDSITIITLSDVPFSWKPGQHFRLWLPQVGLIENHPFTAANQPQSTKRGTRNKIQFVVRARSGFSKRINKHAETAQQGNKPKVLRAFISGPLGSTCNWDAYETIVLISASTGGSFTLPILEKVLSGAAGKTCVRRIRFLILARRRSDINVYIQRIPEALSRGEVMGIDLSVEIAITKNSREAESLLSAGGDPSSLEDDEKRIPRCVESEVLFDSGIEDDRDMRVEFGESSAFSATLFGERIVTAMDQEPGSNTIESHAKSHYLAPNSIIYSSGRPSIADFIRIPVEKTHGETTVVVCGGRSLVGGVRNCVARLSNERAVHKGTGAQGIHLYTEEYSL